ncbi:MAG TPA: MXAN_5187 C-terminal domain-containing protein [Candidatus Acidoferrum sp.]|nr:MXAN_5187 C-terminal domain-containing protein [Candidatus Acidoferrum sp.]
MATIDEELGQIERDIRQLKIEYDQYFGGGRKRPPTEIEWRIDLLMKKYSERGGDLKSGQRFRFNNLSQTYAKYKDIFRKKLKQKEEGTVQRHFGAAAKAIEAERKRAADAAASAEAAGSTTVATEPGAFRMTCSEPDRESEKVEKLYQALISAKQQAGEDVGKLTPANFAEFVRKKTKDLQQQKNCTEVEYIVEVVGGQAKLKALVKA